MVKMRAFFQPGAMLVLTMLAGLFAATVAVMVYVFHLLMN